MKKFKIEWSDKSYRIDFSGSISMADIDEANKILNGDERYYSSQYSLWDFTNADMSRIVPCDIDSAVAIDLGAETTLKHHRLAIIACTPHEKYITKCYVDIMKGHETTWSFGIFSNENEALAWLHA